MLIGVHLKPAAEVDLSGFQQASDSCKTNGFQWFPQGFAVKPKVFNGFHKVSTYFQLFFNGFQWFCIETYDFDGFGQYCMLKALSVFGIWV